MSLSKADPCSDECKILPEYAKRRMCQSCRLTIPQKCHVATSEHTQFFMGDCLNVMETRLGPSRAAFLMPCAYMYLASLVIICVHSVA